MLRTVGAHLARISGNVLREDADGRVLYFPWGPCFRGFVVETEGQRHRVLILNSIHIFAGPIVAILALRFGGWPGAFAVLIVQMLAFAAILKVIFRKPADRDPARTPGEAMIALAGEHSRGWLAAMVVASALLVLGGAALIAEGRTVLGAAAIAFFVLTGAVHAGAMLASGERRDD